MAVFYIGMGMGMGMGMMCDGWKVRDLYKNYKAYIMILNFLLYYYIWDWVKVK